MPRRRAVCRQRFSRRDPTPESANSAFESRPESGSDGEGFQSLCPRSFLCCSQLGRTGPRCSMRGGVLRATMTILQPPAEAVAEDETGKGGRQTTAAKVSAVSAALTIAVSEDGTITLYSKGQRILRVMG